MRKKMRKELLIAIIFVVFIIAVSIFGENGLLSSKELRKIANNLQKEIQLIEADNEELRKEIHALKNDPSIIEKITREELGLTREGEIIYKFSPRTH